ncbi:methyltransferase domain-containing protein [Nocardia sp. CDC160]|uniref:methyltransferase domain-containing protein n=1 Tax=Nocardia sp. CDC160 TaxID=3112166 RepID=UPI002DBC2071|nr:methyltransferase domain-containing protein [Nocardia sp. CDC160]MEC3914964.1 methyltransferase domain-containing protein [Nocardia sp. CDC160]
MTGSGDPSAFGVVDANAPDYFIRFLDQRRTIADERAIKALILELLEPRPGSTVLDVGCGPGDDAAEIARLVGAGGSVLGIDISAAMVAEARRRTAELGLPLRFEQGDAQSLDLVGAAVEGCCADRVLAVVPDPARVFAEMVRVTRPGGRLVVSEIDAGTIFVSSSHTDLVRRLTRSLADDLPHGDIGRHLPRLFTDAHLEDVRCFPRVVRNTVAFSRVVMGNRLRAMVAHGETTAAEVSDFWAELERAEREGWLCTGVTCFTVAGRKPRP